MMQQPILLTPEAVSVLTRCPLHYHFLQQQPALSRPSEMARLVKETIHFLHASGGPGRLSLRKCLGPVLHDAAARQMVERYYLQLRSEWANVIASNETMTLRISLAGVRLALRGVVDRLDKSRDGGVIAILLRPDAAPPAAEAERRHDPALTIYHALVAATYPLKRPVRLQEQWLRHGHVTTIELSEDEYRHNLTLLRKPVQQLARNQTPARPGLHCDSCPFKYRGCPVYADESPPTTDPVNFDPADSGGKIPPRRWVFDADASD